MKKLYLIIIVLLTVCVIYDEYKINHIAQDRSFYDMPEEFNIETTSKDRTNPTMMMVIYDTTYNKFVFEYIDK
jgi:hypothetical protein